jgi:hypothetical protein
MDDKARPISLFSWENTLKREQGVIHEGNLMCTNNSHPTLSDKGITALIKPSIITSFDYVYFSFKSTHFLLHKAHTTQFFAT